MHRAPTGAAAIDGDADIVPPILEWSKPHRAPPRCPHRRSDLTPNLVSPAKRAGKVSVGEGSWRRRSVSDRFGFSLSLRLDCDLTLGEYAMLDHLLCGRGPEPKDLPNHDAFQAQLDTYRFQELYRDFPMGAFTSEFWSWRNAAGRVMQRGVRLDLPWLSPEMAFGPLVAFADWIVGLSPQEGFVGAITAVEGATPPFLLLAHDRRLAVVPDYARDPTPRWAKTGAPLPQALPAPPRRFAIT